MLFRSLPKENKVKALSDLIQGVGPKSAEYLVATNAFSRKPRSWAEFADIIIAADDVLRSGFSKNVLVKFEDENKKALGYEETRADCRVETKDVNVLQTVDVKVFVRNLDLPVRIELANAPLLAGESEEFKVDRKSTRLNSSHSQQSRMPSSA